MLLSCDLKTLLMSSFCDLERVLMLLFCNLKTVLMLLFVWQNSLNATFLWSYNTVNTIFCDQSSFNATFLRSLNSLMQLFCDFQAIAYWNTTFCFNYVFFVTVKVEMLFFWPSNSFCTTFLWPSIIFKFNLLINTFIQP